MKLWVINRNDELQHHGTKGMKWGVRRYQNPDGSLTTRGKIRYGAGKAVKAIGSTTKKAVAGIRKKIGEKQAAKKAKEEAEKLAKEKAARAKITSSRRLTDSELKDRIGRLKMEKEYQDLLRDTSPKAMRAGEKFVLEIAESIGKNLLTQVGNHYGAKALNKAIGEDVIYANNKKK